MLFLRQPQRIFEDQDLAAFFCNLFFCKRSRFHGPEHTLQFPFQVSGSQQHIIAGYQGLCTEIGIAGNTLHL